MFTTERFFARILSAWFLIVMISVFMVGVGPKGMVFPAIAAVVLMTGWSVHCAYRTKYFTTYAGYQIFFNLSIAPSFASMLTLAIAYKTSKLSAGISLLLASMPIGLAVFMYLVIYTFGGDDKKTVLNFKGDYVESLEQPRQGNWWHAGFAAIIGGMVYPIFKSQNMAMPGLIYFFVALSIFMTIYHRSNIVAYKKLRVKESSKNVRYKLMDIELIQRMRAKSLLGKLFVVRSR